MKIHALRALARIAVPCAAFLVFSLSVQGAGSSVAISGTPVGAVSAGQPFSFAPRGTVSGAGTPRFEIQNKPAWASFSAFNGRLSGVPSNADAGVYAGIRISITDGVSRASLPTFAITVHGMPQIRSVTLSWQPPTENTDDSVLTDLAGYRIYSGTSVSALSLRVSLSNPSLSRYVVEELAPGQHFFALTAVNAAGRESPLSAIVGTRIP